MSATRADLPRWLEEALRNLGGHARIVDIAREIARVHGKELLAAGDLNYTWHYDMRWAALKLSKEGRLYLSNKVGQGRWALAEKAR